MSDEEVTVRQVMESRMEIAIREFLNKPVEVKEFTQTLTDIAFSTAGIPEKEQNEPW